MTFVLSLTLYGKVPGVLTQKNMGPAQKSCLGPDTCHFRASDTNSSGCCYKTTGVLLQNHRGAATKTTGVLCRG